MHIQCCLILLFIEHLGVLSLLEVMNILALLNVLVFGVHFISGELLDFILFYGENIEVPH